MKAMLHDVTRCTGCMECVKACSTRAGAPPVDEHCDLKRGTLCADRLTTVELLEDRWVRRHCHHCMEPSCVAACLVGALRKTKEGPVIYDRGKCIGCRYCMLACTLRVPRYEWDKATPLMRKCDMCHDRPGGPTCAEVCPQKAVLFGEREELIDLAWTRIEEGKKPYLKHVWGEKEMGGTCVLFISDVSLDPLWPTTVGTHSIPELTQPFVSKTPWIALTVAGGLSLGSFIINRRNRLMGGHGKEER